jgi:hypothetical protein
MTDRSSNEADFLCILLYLAWRLWQSVVTLAVKGNTICGRLFRRQGVPWFERHRLPLTGNRWDITMADRSSNEADFLCISCIERGGYGKVLWRSP